MALPISYNIRNLIVRWKVTLLAIGGIALVVAVMLVLVAMSNGFRMALRATGLRRQRHRHPARAELRADLRVHPRQREHDHGGRRAWRATTRASRWPRPKSSIVNNMPRRQDGASVNVVVRGVTPQAFKVRSIVKIVAGRALHARAVRAGRRQEGFERTSASRSASRSISSAATWKVVGVFEADGSGFESEIWGDLEVMGPAFNRNNGYSSLTLRLTDPLRRRSRRSTRT